MSRVAEFQRRIPSLHMIVLVRAGARPKNEDHYEDDRVRTRGALIF